MLVLTMTSKDLFVTIGVPASGKSTWIKQQKNAVSISPDDIRKELYGDYQIGISSKEVWDKAHERIQECLEKNDGCVFDATSTLPTPRKRLIEFGKQADAKVTAVYFPINVKFAIYRNGKRFPKEKRVPNYIIHKFHDELKRMKNPIQELKDEGFDHVMIKRQVPTKHDCDGMGGKIRKNECEICDYLDIK